MQDQGAEKRWHRTARRAVAAVTFIAAVARSSPKIFPDLKDGDCARSSVCRGYYPQSSMGEGGLEGMIRVFDRLLCPFWRFLRSNHASLRCELVSRRGSRQAETF